jgi:hypothetical protein
MDDRIINKRYGIAFSDSIPVDLVAFKELNELGKF